MGMIEIFGQPFDLDNPQSAYFHVDCMEGMAKFPDKYFDLAVVDPPYGIGESGIKASLRGGTQHGRWAKGYKMFAGGDKEPASPEYFAELFRISKKQVIWGAYHFLDNIQGELNSDCWLVWDKENDASNFGDCELAWTNLKGAVRIFRFKWNGYMQGNMKHKEHRIHPTQKPVALYRWIFDKYTERGMKLLDTHVGSASSLIAAHDAGLMYVGFELDDYYYEKSKQRLDEHTAQINLFDFIPAAEEKPEQMELFGGKEGEE